MPIKPVYFAPTTFYHILNFLNVCKSNAIESKKMKAIVCLILMHNMKIFRNFA